MEEQLLPGNVVDGRFRIEDVIGQGGMGQVWRATDLELNRAVAIKFLTSSRLGEAQTQRFLREGELLAGLRHRGILPVHGSGVVDGVGPYLVTALIEGARELGDYVEGRPLAERLECFVSLTEAMAFAHSRGVLHRDIKPANVLLDREGQLYLCDFGLAWAPGVADLTRSRDFMGTPLYASPESLSGGDLRSAQGDVYSLGVLLYELLAGSHPFASAGSLIELIGMHAGERTPPSLLNPAVTPALEAVCLRAMAAEPEARFGDAGELSEALGFALEGRRTGEVGGRLGLAVIAGLATLVLGVVWASTRLDSSDAAPEISQTSPLAASPAPTTVGAALAPSPTVSPEHELGLKLMYGEGTSQDFAAAQAHLERAARSGNTLALYDLVDLLIMRHPSDKASDYAEARRWLRSVVKLERAPALRRMGDTYAPYDGRVSDQGLHYYRQAAARGSARGLRRVVIELHARGEERELPLLMQELERLAKLGSNGGGAEYDLALAFGAVDPLNAQRITGLLREAADQGHGEGLAMCGIKCVLRGQIDDGVRFLEGAVERRSPVGMRELGECYRRGIFVRLDVRLGARLIRRAARLGDASAMYRHAKTLYKSDPALSWLCRSGEHTA